MLKLTQFPKKKFAKKGKPFRLKCNAGNFQCGGSCKNIAYKNKAGQMAYTKCGKNAEGGAKTGLEWLQYVKSRRQRLKGKFGDKFTVDATGKVIRRRNQPNQPNQSGQKGGALTVQPPGVDLLYSKLQDGLQKANKLIKEKSSPSLESLRDRLQSQITELEQQKPELNGGALAKQEKPAPDDTPLPREEKTAPKRDNSRFGRLLQQMEETEIEDAKNTAGILGVAGKLYETVERLSGVKGADREVELPEIDTTETPKRKFSKLIDDLDDLNKEDVQNTAKALGVAGKLFQTVQGLADRMDGADSGLPTSKPAPMPRADNPPTGSTTPSLNSSVPTDSMQKLFSKAQDLRTMPARKKNAKISNQNKSEILADGQTKIFMNTTALESKRNDLIATHGVDLIEKAEKRLKYSFYKKPIGIFVAVPSAEGVSAILQSRFKNTFELGSDKYKDAYAPIRKRVEESVMGIPQDTPNETRPIYGYLASTDTGYLWGHQDTSTGYGSIAIQLKRTAMTRATFTGADSFKSGYASSIVEPNAASIVQTLLQGNPVDTPDRESEKQTLTKIANMQYLDELLPNVQGKRYIEAQVYGGVSVSDIQAIHFRPKRSIDMPTADILSMALKNNIGIVINGVQLTNGNIAKLAETMKTKQQNPESSAEMKSILTVRSFLEKIKSAVDAGNPYKKDSGINALEEIASIFDAIESIRSNADKVKIQENEAPDQVTKYLIQQLGYDRPPSVAPPSEFALQARDNKILMVRSVRSYKDKTATDIFDQLRYGDYHLGRGVYGNGIYATHTGNHEVGVSFLLSLGDADTRKKALEASRNGYGDESIVMTMEKTSQIMMIESANQYKIAVDAFLREATQSLPKSKLAKSEQDKYKKMIESVKYMFANNYSAIAILLGYDAIGARRSPFLNVLNRSVLTIRDTNIAPGAEGKKDLESIADTSASIIRKRDT